MKHLKLERINWKTINIEENWDILPIEATLLIDIFKSSKTVLISDFESCVIRDDKRFMWYDSNKKKVYLHYRLWEDMKDAYFEQNRESHSRSSYEDQMYLNIQILIFFRQFLNWESDNISVMNIDGMVLPEYKQN